MNKFNILASDFILGALIAILSVLTAFTSWQYSNADGTSAGYNREGLLMLTDANAEYLTANQYTIQDYTYFDTYYLNYKTNPEISEYYEQNFSEALRANMERGTDFFDEQYYTDMGQAAEDMFDEADRLFNLASKIGERSDRLQLAMLVFAVALSFTAWGSLLEKGSVLRLVFSLLSMLVMMAGIAIYLTAPVIPI